MASSPSIFLDTEATKPNIRGRLLVPCASAILAIASLMALPHGSNTLGIVLVGCIGLVILALSWVYTLRHRETAIVVLVLVETLSSNAILPQGVTTAARYGLNLLFCAPLLPLVWNSRIFRKGGFQLLLIYFAWCLITVTYSLVPLYSAGRLFSSVLLIPALISLSLEVSTGEDIARFLRYYLIACGVIAAIMVMSAFLLPHSFIYTSLEMLDANGNPIPGSVDFNSGGVSRFVGILGQPNQVGELAVAIIGPAIAYWSFATRWGRILLTALIGVAIALGVAADARASMGSVVVGSLAFFVWKYRSRGILLFGAVAALVGLLLVATVHDFGDYVGRGDVTTFTGRTDVWEYTVDQIKDSPLLGYGYEVEGQIYQLRHFPIWWGPWDDGPKSSIHNDYLSHLVGIGIPATLLWLFLIIRPWFSLFRRRGDPWGLKPLAFLVVMPVLILDFFESGLGDCHYALGLIFVFYWALAERTRLLALERAADDQTAASAAMPPIFAAIASAGK